MVSPPVPAEPGELAGGFFTFPIRGDLVSIKNESFSVYLCERNVFKYAIIADAKAIPA
jgi:hypothetical protein